MVWLLAIKGTPDIPNILTFFRHYIANPPWLHHWESIIFSIFIAALIAMVFYIGSRKKKLIPSGLQNVLEYVVETFRTFIIGILGPSGEKYIPFLGTLFIYILAMNLFGLIPLMKSPSSNLNIIIALGLCVSAIPADHFLLAN